MLALRRVTLLYRLLLCRSPGMCARAFANCREEARAVLCCRPKELESFVHMRSNRMHFTQVVEHHALCVGLCFTHVRTRNRMHPTKLA